MLHKKTDFESSTTTLGEDDTQRELEHRITDQEAVRCALSIPEEFVPTPHKDFIKDLEVKQESKTKHLKERPMMSPMKTTKPSIQNGEGEFRITNKALLVRERERKLRSAFAKYKKWDENERCKVDKLEGNRVMVNDSFVLEHIDHTNYIKEQDVILELDEDWRKCSMPPSPAPASEDAECKSPTCRLGCICESIKRDPVSRSHCGKPRCFFDCTCQQSLFNNGDDGDIRSRLRPRVSLLNWRFMETTERDKDPPPVNYRQLERGVTVYPRMRRVAVAPQRFRNEYIMSSKFKDTFGRERRKSVTGITKFIRKQPTSGVKRDSTGSIYRRSYLVKSNVKHKDTTMPGKMNKCKPCTVSIDQMKPDSVEDPPEPKEQEPLKIPNLIRMIQRDGQILLMGVDEICFVNFTLEFKQPKAIIYERIEGDVLDIPWLYLPFSSANETWLFHPIENLEDTTFTYVPEINCVFPSKALQMHLNVVQTQKKTVALKILWVGQDSKKRCGHIYILPALPNVLICGPFPRQQIKTRFSPDFNKLERSMDVGAYLDDVTTKRYLGDEQSWSSYVTKKKERINAALKENLLKDEASNTNEIIPNEVMEMEMRSIERSSNLTTPSPPPVETENLKSDKLCVSWNDAAKMLSVQP